MNNKELINMKYEVTINDQDYTVEADTWGGWDYDHTGSFYECYEIKIHSITPDYQGDREFVLAQIYDQEMQNAYTN